MAQTYGYTTNNYTSYGGGGGADGGGFMNQGGVFGGSQAGGSQDGSGSKYGKETLRPVTIKQILDAQQPHPDAEFKLDGHEITQIAFVGQIRNVSVQVTHTTYKIDDGTSLLEVKQWPDGSEQDPETPRTAKFEQNTWVRVMGRLKSFNNKRHVGAHMVRAITDNNEIFYHLLEATYVHLFLSRGPLAGAAGAGANGMGGVNGVKAEDGGGGLFVEQGAGTGPGGQGLPAMSPMARRVFNQLQSTSQSNEGLHVQTLASQLNVPSNEVFKAGDELLSLGIIYTTVDDETWAVLEY